MKNGKILTLLLALIVTAAMVFAIPAVVSSAAEGDVMAVYHNGSETPTNYSDFANGWNAAITQNTEENTTTVKLLTDWTAVDGSFGTGNGFYEGAILIPSEKTITLDLNGYTIDRGLETEKFNGYVIINRGTLTITDSSETATGAVTGGYNEAFGGGVYNYEYSSFTMNGGKISGNTAFLGGGVYNRGNFTMTGGVISGNDAEFGGGVYNDINSQSFTISGGKISGNTARENGGGVHNSSTFTMTGGEISGNTATKNGGGVQNSGSISMQGGKIFGNTAIYGGGVYNSEYGTLNLSGGEIFGNTAESRTSGGGGGIYNNYFIDVLQGTQLIGTLNFSGNPVIKDNFIDGTFSEEDGVYIGDISNNVKLFSICYINISDGNDETKKDSLSSGAEIWVTTEYAPTVEAPIFITGNDNADNSIYFHSDKPVTVCQALFRK